MDASHKTYLKRIREFIPKERIYTDDLHCLAWGTDAGFYRNWWCVRRTSRKCRSCSPLQARCSCQSHSAPQAPA